MAKKEFKKSYMHPTRRKLADMVRTGEYEKESHISLSSNGGYVPREVGDIWEDKHGNVWEQKEFGRVKKSKMTETLSKVRNYLEEQTKCKDTECSVAGKYSSADKRLILHFGYCVGCLAKRELPIKVDGLWNEYLQYRNSVNDIAYFTDVLQKLKQAVYEVSNLHEYINDDGSVERWWGGEDADVLKAEIQSDIDKVDKKIAELAVERDEAYDKIKHKNYELVKKLDV